MHHVIANRPARHLVLAALCVCLIGCSAATASSSAQDDAIRMAGDSNTVGHGVTPYVTYVSEALDTSIDNLGVAGMAMTFESDYGLTYSTSIPDIIRANIAADGTPKVLTIMGGTNDFKWWGETATTNLTDLESVASSLDAELTAEGVDVIWITPPPFSDAAGFPSSAKADRLTYDDWLDQTFPGRVANCGQLFQDSTGAMIPSVDSGDGVHLNAAGQQILATCVESALQGRT